MTRFCQRRPRPRKSDLGDVEAKRGKLLVGVRPSGAALAHSRNFTVLGSMSPL
ncbi:hypothetical protein ES332_A08G125000v1 [Gossypium tomentosum]|uniref:Uncharacterized protein n=1 Tax=Gossypium tomentosum TaxID=34277 RepID=A0A5D2PDM9_GOSTO|nr:hypothetical protein ES332_A08G125000v1 [Gossypium tomentosum]